MCRKRAADRVPMSDLPVLDPLGTRVRRARASGASMGPTSVHEEHLESDLGQECVQHVHPDPSVSGLQS
jgi:hypothetical protein